MWYNWRMSKRAYRLDIAFSAVFAFSALAWTCASAGYVGRPAPGHDARLRRHTGIPSLAVSPANGRLWVTFYGGVTPGEDSNNYVELVTSADGGRTWKTVLVADPDGSGPKRAFDPELWVAPDGRLRWTFTERVAKLAPDLENYKKPYAGDEGDPKTDRLMCVELDADREPADPLPAPRAVARGVMMCKPTVLDDGAWLWPVAHWREEPSACFYATTDGGRTFALRGGATLPQDCRLYDEQVVVQLRNGDLLTFIRANWKKPFHESVSHDRGRTWEAARPARFAHTSARLFLRRLASGSLLLVKHGRMDEDVGRSQLRAFVSDDDGATWKGGMMIDERDRIAYPDGDQSADGTIYIVYDHDRMGAQEILFAAFTEADVRAGKAGAGARLRQTVVRKP